MSTMWTRVNCKSLRIKITNDKGCLSNEIERMVADAEKYKQDDEEFLFTLLARSLNRAQLHTNLRFLLFDWSLGLHSPIGCFAFSATPFFRILRYWPFRFVLMLFWVRLPSTSTLFVPDYQPSLVPLSYITGLLISYVPTLFGFPCPDCTIVCLLPQAPHTLVL